MTGLRILLGAVILGGLGAAAPFTPLWLISLATLAMSTGLVVCGLIILWRGGLVPFGQALFFATGAYTVALSGRWFGVTDAFLLMSVPCTNGRDGTVLTMVRQVHPPRQGGSARRPKSPRR